MPRASARLCECLLVRSLRRALLLRPVREGGRVLLPLATQGSLELRGAGGVR